MRPADQTPLEYAVYALADIAFTSDITLGLARRKAARVYHEVRRETMAMTDYEAAKANLIGRVVDVAVPLMQALTQLVGLAIEDLREMAGKKEKE